MDESSIEGGLRTALERIPQPAVVDAKEAKTTDTASLLRYQDLLRSMSLSSISSTSSSSTCSTSSLSSVLSMSEEFEPLSASRKSRKAFREKPKDNSSVSGAMETVLQELKAIRSDEDLAEVDKQWSARQDMMKQSLRLTAEENGLLEAAKCDNQPTKDWYSVDLRTPCIEALMRLRPCIGEIPVILQKSAAASDRLLAEAYASSASQLPCFTLRDLEARVREAEMDLTPCCLGKKCVCMSDMIGAITPGGQRWVCMARVDFDGKAAPADRMCVLDEILALNDFLNCLTASEGATRLQPNLRVQTFTVATNVDEDGIHPRRLMVPRSPQAGILSPFPEFDLSALHFLRHPETGKIYGDLSLMGRDPLDIETVLVVPASTTSTSTSSSVSSSSTSSVSSSSSSTSSSSSQTNSSSTSFSSATAAAKTAVNTKKALVDFLKERESFKRKAELAPKRRPKDPRISSIVRTSAKLQHVLLNVIQQADQKRSNGNSKFAVDTSLVMTDHLFHQTCRRLQSDPLPFFAEAFSHVHAQASFLFSYPVLPQIACTPSTWEVEAKEEERLSRLYFQLCWSMDPNQVAVGFTDSNFFHVPDLSEKDLAQILRLCQKNQLPRAFVRQYYSRMASCIFAGFSSKLKDTFIVLCAATAARFEVRFSRKAVDSLVSSRFCNLTERFWWWKICYCRLVVLLSIKPPTSEKEACDRYYPLLDESLLVVAETLNSSLIAESRLPLFTDLSMEQMAPDPSDRCDCIHGSLMTPNQFTVPFLSSLHELLLTPRNPNPSIPLYALLFKVLFHPSQTRMLPSVFHKLFARSPALLRQVLHILVAVLLGNFSGEVHLPLLEDRVALLSCWSNLDRDIPVNGPEWTPWILFIAHAPNVLTLVLRFYVLHAASLRPSLFKSIGQRLDATKLWTLVREGVLRLRELWCTNMDSFLRPRSPLARVEKELSVLDGSFAKQFRARILKLCTRKPPGDFFAALAKARKTHCPIPLPEKCLKCSCHTQSHMQCFLDPIDDKPLLDFLVDFFRRLPADYPAQCTAPLLLEVMVFVAFDKEELAGMKAVVDAFYYHRKPRHWKTKKETLFLHVLRLFSANCNRAWSFVLTFALMFRHMTQFHIIETGHLSFSPNARVEPVRVLASPYDGSTANDGLCGGFHKVRVDLSTDPFSPLGYCSKSSKSTNKACECGCQIQRESKVSDLPMLSAELEPSQFLSANNGRLIYRCCAVPECIRIFSLSSELCCYSDFFEGYMCPICSIESHETRPRLVCTARWRALFSTFSDLSGKRKDARDPVNKSGGAKLPPCHICASGVAKFASRFTSNWKDKKDKKGRKGKVKTKGKFFSPSEKRKRRSSRESIRLPGWDFDLVLCAEHADDAEFVDALYHRQPRLKQNPRCLAFDRCHCSNGVTTCSGLTTLGFCVGMWNNLQESARTADILRKNMDVLHPSDRQKSFYKRQRVKSRSQADTRSHRS